MSDSATALIRALTDNLQQAPEEWTSLSMVLGFDNEKVNSAFGFVFDAEGIDTGVTASPYELRSAVKEFTDDRYRAGEALPVGLLLQFDRESGRFEVTFEDTDRDRWKVIPANFDSIADDLRPTFD